MSDIQDARAWASRILSRVENGGTLGTPAEANAAEVLLRITEPRPVAELESMPPLSGAVGPNGEEVVVLWWRNDPDARLTALIKSEDGVWTFWTGLDPDKFKSTLERYELRRL